MSATSEWSKQVPTKTGEYLVEIIGDWFPDGDLNNIRHSLVDLVVDEDDGIIKILSNGSFLEADECAGWAWAKVIPLSKGNPHTCAP